MSGHIITTADDYKYLRRKYAVKSVYLKCALFRDGCKQRQNWIGIHSWLPRAMFITKLHEVAFGNL